ncbi:hypothetical protein [Actinosynnema sp. NPDC023587]|uniref:hypothetical protein n=1 Tax=Actinosynnema sp. NPDC023587 TaxID=3154695 RepID=UPI0033D4200D
MTATVDVLALKRGDRIEVARGRSARVVATTERCSAWRGAATVHTDDGDYLLTLPYAVPLATPPAHASSR